jgi:hypothetical protein
VNKKILFFLFFIIIFINACIKDNKITCEIFINEIIQNDLTTYAFIERHGVPNKKDEFDEDCSYGFVTLYYGNNLFRFWVNDKENINAICDWKIIDDLYKYFPYRKKINKDTIINIFKNNYDERYDDFFNEYYVRYLLDDSTLIFIFKEDKLSSIEWSIDR